MAHMDYGADEPVLISTWRIDDVKSIAPWVSDDEAVEILASVADNHDANLGINWEVIEFWVDNLYPEPDNWTDPEDEDED